MLRRHGPVAGATALVLLVAISAYVLGARQAPQPPPAWPMLPAAYDFPPVRR